MKSVRLLRSRRIHGRQGAVVRRRAREPRRGRGRLPGRARPRPDHPAVYALTLARLEKAVGSSFPVAEVEADAAKEFLRTTYPKASPATWNRNLATLKSFCAYCRRQGWMV